MLRFYQNGARSLLIVFTAIFVTLLAPSAGQALDRKYQIIQLFGPQHPGFPITTNGTWQYPGASNSASIKWFPFVSQQLSKPVWARWTLIWMPPPSGAARLNGFTQDGNEWWFANMQAINYSNPTPQRLDITAELQAIWASSDRYIGLQVYTQPGYPGVLYESTLEIVSE